MQEELSKIFIGLRDGFLAFIPKLLLALLVLGLGYLLARLVKYLIIKFVNHVSQLIKRRFNNINLSQSTTLIGAVFFWLILLYTVLLVTDILELSIVTAWMDRILMYTPNLLAAIMIVLAAIILGKFISEFISSAGNQLEMKYVGTLGRILQTFIIVTAVIIAIDQIGVEVTFLTNLIDIILAAFLFGAALAFGVGARTSVSNILATFYVRKMYKEGDHVKIGEAEGRVVRIDSTVVVLDNESGQVFIPAKEFNETKSFLIKRK